MLICGLCCTVQSQPLLSLCSSQGTRFSSWEAEEGLALKQLPPAFKLQLLASLKPAPLRSRENCSLQGHLSTTSLFICMAFETCLLVGRCLFAVLKRGCLIHCKPPHAGLPGKGEYKFVNINGQNSWTCDSPSLVLCVSVCPEYGPFGHSGQKSCWYQLKFF